MRLWKFPTSWVKHENLYQGTCHLSSVLRQPFSMFVYKNFEHHWENLIYLKIGIKLQDYNDSLTRVLDPPYP